MTAAWNLECSILAAAVIHEAGHYAACKIVGAKTYGLKWRLVPVPGIGIGRDYTHNRLRDAFISAAGPLANLCTVLLLLVPHIGHYVSAIAVLWFVSGNLLMGLVSLIPVGKQDGACIWKQLKERP